MKTEAELKKESEDFVNSLMLNSKTEEIKEVKTEKEIEKEVEEVSYKDVEVGDKVILVGPDKKAETVSVIFVFPDLSINTQNDAGQLRANVPYIKVTKDNLLISPYPYWRLSSDPKDLREVD